MQASGSHQTKGSGHPHANFQSRSARDDAGELNRRFSQGAEAPSNPYEPSTNGSTPPPREHAFTNRLLHLHPNSYQEDVPAVRRRSTSGRRKQASTMGEDSLTTKMQSLTESKKADGDRDASGAKPGLGPRPVGGREKLGMFSGVYVPTCLNVLSILMFLRFGFILGLLAPYPIFFVNEALTKF
jgi:potassium/chloride transporter 9